MVGGAKRTRASSCVPSPGQPTAWLRPESDYVQWYRIGVCGDETSMGLCASWRFGGLFLSVCAEGICLLVMKQIFVYLFEPICFFKGEQALPK